MKIKHLPTPKYDVELMFAVEPDVPVEYQQAISACAHLSWDNRYPVDVLSGVELGPNRLKRERQGMADWWGIEDEASAIQALDWLLREGHRAHWPQMLEALRDPQAGKASGERAAQFAGNLRQAVPRLIELGLIANARDIERMGLEAWDYARAAHVARESHHIGYLSEEQAWRYILAAFEGIKQRYDTWIDFAHACLVGRYAWGGLGLEHLDFNKVVTTMLRYPLSTWNRYPLNPAFQQEYERQRLALVGEIEPAPPAESAPAARAPQATAAGTGRSPVIVDPRAEKAQRPGLVRRLLDIPVLGDYLATAIGLLVPFAVLVCLGVLLKGVFHLPIDEGRAGKLFFVPGLASLVFLWNRYLAAKQKIRITLPIIPIPLTWVAAFFFVVGMLAAYF